MRTVDLIQRKRNGEELSPEEIRWLVEAYTRNEIPDYQVAAFLMAVYFQNMTDHEVGAMVDAMIDSGERVDLSMIPGPKIDKHSTGGVGDKTSLIAGPLAAAAGVKVPMVSGRALGHTGGTLDKLESIPGLRTNLSLDEFRDVLNRVGFAVIGQSESVTPADGKLYALRDATATVESPALIAASIMSKKLAMGLDGLVLDVKVGSGAFMKRQVDARRLAQLMVTIARRNDLRAQALITDMNQPLGRAIGNALEIMEVSQTLLGAGPDDLTQISLELAARMIFLGKITETLEDARELATRLLLERHGYMKLKEMIAAQGGDPQVLDRFELLPNALHSYEIVSPRAGWVAAIDAEEMGRASSMLGAGRDKKEDTVDPAVGVFLEVKVGSRVDEGDVLCRIHYSDPEGLQEAVDRIEDAFRISNSEPEPRQLVLEVVG
jgi:pyrimidine-nucleoside phosphorylase/thymidine phosphorylase